MDYPLGLMSLVLVGTLAGSLVLVLADTLVDPSSSGLAESPRKEVASGQPLAAPVQLG